MRYLLLILLNVPVIFFALLNIITQYKMHRVTRQRFYQQLLIWLVILVTLLISYPLYNFFIGRPLLDSTDLSSFDIVEVTATVFLLYVVNDQRRKIDQTDKRLNDLHRTLSIRLSERK